MGNAQSRQVLTEVRSDWGHVSTGPSAVWDQSSSRIRRAISVWPGKISSSIPLAADAVQEICPSSRGQILNQLCSGHCVCGTHYYQVGTPLPMARVGELVTW